MRLQTQERTRTSRVIVPPQDLRHLGVSFALAMGILTGCVHPLSGQTSVDPKGMRVIGEVDQRFVSYNVEAVEVTGGRFWAPYNSRISGAAEAPLAPPGPNQPRAADPRFKYRNPIDLSNSKLRKLAAALGPAYMRVSGSWLNATYFQDNDQPALKTPPEGFNGVLTRAEWKGVVDFAHSVDGEIVSSVATSMGTRDAKGVWTPNQAKALLDYTKRIGGRIAATEFMNEPTLPAISGAGNNYDAKEFGRDAKIFAEFIRRESPHTIFLGPGSAAEGLEPIPSNILRVIPTKDLMEATGPIFDGFSYHFYSTRSRRCNNSGPGVEKLLTQEWFQRNLTVEEFYAKLRDTYLPGKDLWLTETGEASCGGDTWASQFADSFRLLDQFGSLAQKSVKAIMYNTLASSDYGMLDEESFDPRPNYWAALLWKRLMGTRSLDPGLAPSAQLRVYAQCAKGSEGGVTLLALSLDKASAASINVPVSGERYTLSSTDLLSKKVLLNGVELTAGSDGGVPSFKGEPFKAGAVQLPPATITFLVLSGAGNSGCKH